MFLFCKFRVLAISILLAGSVQSGSASAETLTIAVATNFQNTAHRLRLIFQEKHPEHQIRLAAGSTGKLYTQIQNGAPFDIFLAADQERPKLLEEAGLAVPGSRFTYAIGRLALLSSGTGSSIPDILTVLEKADRIALAKPELAPYGMASRQVLTKMNLGDQSSGKLVFGASVGQVFSLVATGAASTGFVALSQVKRLRSRDAQIPGVLSAGWHSVDVPVNLHGPIYQDGIILNRSAVKDVAELFMVFLRSKAGQEAIKASGYEIEPGHE